ncbi:Bilin biosynthesis protein PecE [Synechococcus sp. MIT S9509]|uniref:HEAT repeat domain-containing protein n=1 Tax=unclassified Synechococcus TaxID=2626047 RepID=UPI0007BBCE4D|nr:MULTISPECIES: HEAT repeat domain-containing protein [unclassified Synechococcus]KZR86381.1 Bilin biosynthesis protein PecE [Synechococcus sp. MIT S9504]KZR93481.1 Bilin biosynthesis protein PecE [Synechococcus sp. MIT S9509]
MIPINSTQSALEALDHEDAGVRYHGAWWLGKHRAFEAVPKLIDCLKDEREITSSGGYPLRRQAARSLGMIREASCVHALLETLETDDVQLHEATLRALIEIKSDQCSSSLINYLDKDIHNKPIEALIEALASLRIWQVSEKIQPFLRSDSERVVSSAASFFFCCTGDKSYLDQVVALLNHENRFVRQSAAFDLARIGTFAAAKPILAANIPNNVKMYAIRAILSDSLLKSTKRENNQEAGNEEVHDSLFTTLDELTRENFAGNLLISQEVQKSTNPEQPPSSTAELISNAFERLGSPSLMEREQGIKLLVNSPESIKGDLHNLYFSESDQDIKMGLVKAMAKLKDRIYIPALIDAVGVEIGNHCQGNIRRVAACALGDIDWIQQADHQSLTITLDKLSWTLQYPDDWGLRYGACIALEGIADARARDLLIETSEQETDPVISRRINIAIARMSENNDP